jgi:hypothetical protein
MHINHALSGIVSGPPIGSVVPPTGRIHKTGKANQEIVINHLIKSPSMRLLEVVLPVGF